jgi:hypothetical protein
VSAVVSGSLSVGSILEGANVKPGTIVTAILTGTGGVGTYTVTPDQTAASAGITSPADLFRCAAPTSLNTAKASASGVFAANSNITSCNSSWAQLAQTAPVGNPSNYLFNTAGASAALLNLGNGGFRGWASDVAGNISALSAVSNAGTGQAFWLNGGVGGVESVANRADGGTAFLLAGGAGAPCSYNVANMDTTKVAYAQFINNTAQATSVNLCNRLDFNWVTLDSVVADVPSAATIYSGVSGTTPVSSTVGASVFTTLRNGRAARSVGAGPAVVTDTAVAGTAAGAAGADTLNAMSFTVRIYAQDARGHSLSIGTVTLADSTVGAAVLESGTAGVDAVYKVAKKKHSTVAWTPGATLNKSYWSGIVYTDFAPGVANRMFAIASTSSGRIKNTIANTGVAATTGCTAGTAAAGTTTVGGTVTETPAVTGCASTLSFGVKTRPFYVTVNP